MDELYVATVFNEVEEPVLNVELEELQSLILLTPEFVPLKEIPKPCRTPPTLDPFSRNLPIGLLVLPGVPEGGV